MAESWKVTVTFDVDVTVKRDRKAEVWYVADSSIPGLSAEAKTKESLYIRIREIVPDLLAKEQK